MPRHLWIVVNVAILAFLTMSSVARADVDSIEPSTVSYFGGTVLTIEGSGLPTILESVFINGVELTITFSSSTLYECIVPPMTIGGPYDLEIWFQSIFGGSVLAESVPGAVTISGPLSVESATPNIIAVSPSAQTITIAGEGFTDNTQFTLVGEPGTFALDPKDFVSATEQVAHVLFPQVLPGLYEIRAQDGFAGGPPVIATLPVGLLVVPPIDATVFTPQEISYLGQTTCRVFGVGFTPVSEVWLGGNPLPTTFVSPTELNCVPPHSFDTPVTEFFDVTIVDPISGTDTIPNAVRYRGPLAMLSTDQPVVLAGQPNYTLDLYGDGFIPGAVVEIGGEQHVIGGGVTYTEAFFTSLPVGVHDIRVTATVAVTAGAPLTTVTAVLENGITVAPNVSPSLISVHPPFVCTEGGTSILVVGENFIPETQFRIAGQPLENATVSLDGTNIMGIAPASTSLGPVTVEVLDFRGSDMAVDLAEYTSTCATLPPPSEFEATRAYGVARFHWFNPVVYDFIDVYDESGTLVETLPGDASSYETPALGDTTALQFVGRTETELSSQILIAALAHNCNYPPPRGGAVTHGSLDMVLRGGHAPADVDRCVYGIPLPPEAYVFPPQPQRQGGDTVGLISQAWMAGLFPRDELRLGFTLDQPADRLDISACYARIAGEFGVSLRARLVHVFPNDGFVDEFTFPDPFISTEKRLQKVTYYRATDDVSAPGVEACLDSSQQIIPIPAGEYRLEIYTVGGDPKIPYYVFADDPRDVQSFIEGVPCPPYPLVQVRDLSGLRTLPNVTDVVVESAQEFTTTVDIAGTPFSFTQVAVDLSARGTWFDFDGTEYSIDTFCDEPLILVGSSGGPEFVCHDPPYNPNPAFEYCWTIHTTEPAQCKIDGPEPTIFLPDWGCYKIELTITDKACGTSRTVQKDMAIVPDDRNLCGPDPFSFRFPSPNPGTVEGVIGLNPDPGIGQFQGIRPLEFRVLVVPDCYCSGGSCAAPELDNVEFRFSLVTPSSTPGPRFDIIPLTGALEVEDLCPDQVEGPKYFHVSFDDLGAIPAHPAVESSRPNTVYLEARSIVGAVTHPWRLVGSPMKVISAPEILSAGAGVPGNGVIWEGYFEPDSATYHFTMKSAEDSLQGFDLPPTAAKDFGLEGAGMPPTDGNYFEAGFTSTLVTDVVSWGDEKGLGGTGGDVMDNGISGAADVVDGAQFPSTSGVPDSPPAWEYCSSSTLFKQEFSQTLFESIIYAGVIGPIPVNIWASVGLGFRFQVQSFLESTVSPFEALSGGDLYSLDFALLTEIDISIPCQITADILAGIASVGISLIPRAEFDIVPYFHLGYSPFGSTDTETGIYHSALMSIDMEAEGCLQTLILGEQCVSVTIPLVSDWAFMEEEGEQQTLTSCSLGPVGIHPGGAGASGVEEVSLYESVNIPVSIVSPDGSTVVDLWVTEGPDGQLAKVNVTEDGVLTTVTEAIIFDIDYFMEPAAAFLSNTEIVLIGTGTPPGWDRLPTPIDPANPAYLTSRNINAAHAEIQLVRMSKSGGVWSIDMTDLTPISDGDATAPEDRRVDGRATIAGDTANGEAIAAWVRYSDDLLVEAPPPAAPQYRWSDVDCGPDYLCLAPTVPFVVKPDIEKSTIVARRVGSFGPLAGEGIEVISDPGINIQPSISVSPSGNTAYCVWVHDPSNPDMLQSNRGRFLKYSIYDRASDTWSAPSDAVEFPDDYPALLEPMIILNGDDDGLLAFTSLPTSTAGTASLRDTGLGGGSRFLYASRLVDGEFREPVEIRGRCDARVYAWGQVAFLVDTSVILAGPELELDMIAPGLMLGWQEYGSAGTAAGTGNLMCAALDETTGRWSDAHNMFPDGTVISNIAATAYRGGVHSVHFSAGAAQTELALGGPVPTGMQIADCPLLPDPAIDACDLKHEMASPGAVVDGVVTVTNHGFTSTPVHSSTGQSVLEVEIVFAATDGSEQVMLTLPVDMLRIKDSVQLPFSVEMPLDPVRLISRLVTGGVDRDASNNQRECFFGAPAPINFGCDVRTLSLETIEDQFCVNLSWENPAIYDRILLYRDGGMIHSLPGHSFMFTDLAVREGEHTYEVRGVIGASKSTKTMLICDVTTAPALSFLRGDANHDVQVNIADAIYSLDYLFVAGPAPPCFASADTNFDGSVNIADTIYLLGYLFQAGPPPSSPFPDCGETTSVSDELLGCLDSGC